MARYEASFEIDEKTDSYAVSRILERVYDAIREESRNVREGADDTTELLHAFESIRDAVHPPTPGKLTIIFEQYDGEFDDQDRNWS